VTTLLDAEAYPASALAELYMMRWRVEENLKSLKQTMKMDVSKCTTVDGVLKELTMYAVAYNLVRLSMCEAGERQEVAVDRVSFLDTLRWLREAEEGEEMPELVVNPLRPGRYEPRVRKRRPKQYPVMKKPRPNCASFCGRRTWQLNRFAIRDVKSIVILMKRGGFARFSKYMMIKLCKVGGGAGRREVKEEVVL